MIQSLDRSVIGFAMLAWAAAAAPSSVRIEREGDPSNDLAVLAQSHAAWAHELYSECARGAVQLQDSVARFVAHPDARTLDAARKAWVGARHAYCTSEVLRFSDGPVEELEPLLNSWPIDEAYIDAVADDPTAGIVNDATRFPNVAETVLVLANERGGEANVSVGWHAIEFLLWGQDRNPAGPGDRSPTDYVVGVGRNAARRAQYLIAITALLVKDLQTVANAWAPDAGGYRRKLTADPSTATRKMLTGCLVLTAFELGGERLTVAYETRDQEQEHSCFSDTTHLDLQANQAGIAAVLTGECDGRRFGPGVLACLRAKDATLASDLERALARTTMALRAIPPPFDAAILGDDDGPGRTSIRGAIESLERQAELLAIAGAVMGYQLPLSPGD
jgi:putative iron-regulated protein